MATGERSEDPDTRSWLALSTCLKGTVLYSTLKGLQNTVADTSKGYKEKIEVFLRAWETVLLFMPVAKEKLAGKVLENLLRHTLTLTFDVRWTHVNKIDKNHLVLLINKCIPYMIRKKCKLVHVFEYIQDILKLPWENDYWKNIMNCEEVDEVRDGAFLRKEGAFLLAFRVECLLVEEQFQTAVDLCETFFKIHERLPTECLPEHLTLLKNLEFTVSGYVSMEKLVAKTLRTEKLPVVLRFIKSAIDGDIGFGINRLVAANGKRVADEMCDILFYNAIGRTTIHDFEYITTENEPYFREIMINWMIVHNYDKNLSSFEDYLKRLVTDRGLSSDHVYLIADIIKSICGDKLRNLRVDLLIRAITYNMNEKLYLDEKHEDYKEMKKEANYKLCSGVMLISELFESKVAICRECILTAFSLSPSSELLEKVHLAALTFTVSSEDEVEEIRSPYFLRAEKCEIDVKKRTLESLIGFYLRLSTHSSNYDPYSAPCEILETDAAEYGLTTEQLHDLINVITGLRNKMLTYALGRAELKYMCDLYLSKDGELWNSTQTLKYLNIDYDMFKDRLPVNDDEFGVIENGYEPVESDRFRNSESSSSSVSCRKRKRKNKVGRKRSKRSKTQSSITDSSESGSFKLVVKRTKNKKVDTENCSTNSETIVRRSERIKLNSLMSSTNSSSNDSESGLPLSYNKHKKRSYSPLSSDPNCRIRKSKEIFKRLCTNDKRMEHNSINKGSSSSLPDKGQSYYDDYKLLRSIVKVQKIKIGSLSDIEGKKTTDKVGDPKESKSDSELVRKSKKTTTKSMIKSAMAALEKKVDDHGSEVSLVDLNDHDLNALMQPKTTKATFSDIEGEPDKIINLHLSNKDSSDSDKNLQRITNVKIKPVSSDTESRRGRVKKLPRRQSSDSDYGTLRRSARIQKLMSGSDSDSRMGSLMMDSDNSNSRIEVSCCKNHSLGSIYGTCRRSLRIKMKSASETESETDSLRIREMRPIKHQNKSLSSRINSFKIYGRKQKKTKVMMVPRKRFMNRNCSESDLSSDAVSFDSVISKKGPITLSPRIVLHDIYAEGNINSNLNYNGNCLKSNISPPLSCVSSLASKKNPCDLINNDMLSKTVPGLTSLDMMVPPPTESTVQVVQLPNNLNPTLSVQSSRSSTSSQSSLNDSIQSDCLVTPKRNQQVSNEQCKPTPLPNTSSSSLTSQTQTSLNSPVVHSSDVSQNSNSTENPAYKVEDVSSQTVISDSQLITYSQVEPAVKQLQSQQQTLKMKPKLTQVIRPAVSQHPTSTSHVENITTNNLLTVQSTVNIHTSQIQVNRQSFASTSQHISPLLLSVQNINPLQSSKTTHLNRKNTNSATFKVADESANPVIDTVVTPVVKYIYKDGKLLQAQDKQGNVQNQKLDNSVATEPQVTGTPNAVVSVQSLVNAEQIVKILDSSSILAKDKSTDGKKFSSQIASLPEFQQAFGKTIYQSNTGTIQIAGSNTTGGSSSNNSGSSQCSSSSSCNNGSRDKTCISEYNVALGEQTNVTTVSSPLSETSSVTLPVMPVCTVLSKAVQTSNKESEVKATNACKTSSTINLTSKLDTVTPRTMTIATTRSIQSTTVNCQNARNIITPTTMKNTSERSGIIQSTTGVIFPCKVSGNLIQRKSVAILKPAITKLELENRSKDTVIHSSNVALLAAALQGSTPLRPAASNTPGTPVQTKVSVVTSGTGKNLSSKTVFELEKKKPEASVQTVLPSASVQRVALPSNMQKNIRRQPVLQPSKFTRPVAQTTSGNTPTLVTSPVVVNRNVTLITQSAIETSVSSKTLEQLREFESVLEQVTNTSQMKERSTVHTQSLESINQQLILPQTSASGNASEFTTTSESRSPTVFQTSTDSVHDVHGRISLTYISQASSVSSNSLISSSNQKITSNTPVVVVQSCNRSITSLSSTCPNSSNTVTASSNSAVSMSKITMKTSKTTKSKSTNKSNPSTATLKVSTLQKPQQKPQEDEQTTQRIYAILDKYAEQLRNSPELKNKPAPRRRSNPPTNPSPTSKRKKSTQTKSKVSSNQPSCSSGMEMSPSGTVGSEDSSNGVTQISQVINSPQTRLDLSSSGDLSSESPSLCKRESLDSKDSQLEQKVVLNDTSPSVQNRAMIVQDSIQSTVINVERTKVLRKQVVVGGTAAMPLISLSNVPGTAVRQVLFPVSTDGRLVLSKMPKMYRVHQVTMPSGSPLLIQPMCVTKPGTNIKQVKPVINEISSQNLTSVSAQPAVVLPSDTSFSLSSESGIETESLGINLDNTILLNTSAQSILASAKITETSEVHTNLEETSTTFTSSSEIPVTCIKPDNVLLSSILPVISSSREVSSSNEYILTSSRPKSDASSMKVLQQEQLKIKEEHDNSTNSSSTRSSNTNNEENGGDDEDKDEKEWSEANKSPQSVSDKEEIDVSTVKSLTLVHNQDSFIGSKGDLGAETCVQKTNNVKKDQSPVVKTALDCEDSVSSSCVKRTIVKGKTQLLQEVSSDTDSPWRYTVMKIGSPKDQSDNSILQRSSLQSNSPVILNQVQTSGLKRKSTENTIYQMAFHRSDRLRRNLKEQDPVDHRNTSLEGELRLQKSLSEECEDLGVDEPSTCDLFPEAELLPDPDPSSRDSHPELLAGMFNQSVESSSNSSRSPVLGEHPSVRRSYKRMRIGDGKATSSSVPSRIINLDNQKSRSSGNSTPVNGGSTSSFQDEFQITSDDSKETHCLQEKSSDDSCKDDDDLGSAWDDEPVCLLSSEQMCPLHEDTSNPAVTTPFTYSNSRNNFSQDITSFRLACRKRKCEYSYDKSWDRTLKDYHPVNGLSDSDSSDRSTNKVNQTTLPSDSSPSPPVSTGGDTGGSAAEHDSTAADSSCIQGQLPSYTLSPRRSSLRGHIKKGCPCCNGSPERPKKKKDKDLALTSKTDIIANFSSSSNKKTCNKNMKKR